MFNLSAVLFNNSKTSRVIPPDAGSANLVGVTKVEANRECGSAMCARLFLPRRTKTPVKSRPYQKRLMSQLSLRTNPENPNHHLWNNNGTWFIHYVVHPTPFTKERIRRSLRTKSVSEARSRRDALLGTSEITALAA